MKCPVCPASDIPDDSLSCPQCKTDLSALQRVRQLHLAEHNEAVRLADSGCLDLALDHTLAALALDEHFVPSMILAGKLFWRKKRFYEAIGRWQRAVSSAPENQEVKELLMEGRAFLKRRRVQCALTVSAASAVALALMLAAVLFPASAFLREEKRTSTLASRLSLLERTSVGQERQPSAIASAVNVPTPGAIAAAVNLDELMNKIRFLSDRQEAMSAGMQSNAVGLLALATSIAEVKGQSVKDLASVTRDIQSSVSNEWLLRSQQWEGVSVLLSTLDAQQKEMSTGQIEEARNVAAVAKDVEDARLELSAVRTLVATDRSRSDQALRMAIAALRPVSMDRLEREISETNEILAAAKTREAGLRDKDNSADAIRHGRAVRAIMEAESRLRTLRMQWEEQVLPWLRASGVLVPSEATTHGLSGARTPGEVRKN